MFAALCIIARRLNPGPAAGMLAAFIVPALCVAAFLVQL